MLFNTTMDAEPENLIDFVLKTAEISEMAEVLSITLPAHLCTFVVILVGTMFPDLSHSCESDCDSNKCKSGCALYKCRTLNKKIEVLFIKEFSLVAVPLLLLTTVSSSNVLYIVVPMTFIIIINLVVLRITSYNSLAKYLSNNLDSVLNLTIKDSKRSFVTCCRSIVGLMTIISILAVDFNVFPSRFSKSGKYGCSLMDIGVGFFVLSNAGVTREEKIAKGGAKQVILGSSVLFSLGLLRYYLIQRVDYHTNVEEYGVHWNFFFTLGAIKLISYLIMRLFCLQPLYAGVLLCIFHQICLFQGLEEYALSDKPRNNWVDANREGLISAVGYTSLYLIGVSLNKFVLKDLTTVSQDIKTVLKLVFVSAVLFLLTISLNSYFPICRRLANLTYIIWIIYCALLHVSVSIVVELTAICLMSPPNYDKYYNFLTPLIYESINYNGLTFFLVGNVLTGLVNILIDTKTVNTIQSMFILTGYLMVNCAVVFYLYCKHIQLKFW